MTLHELALKYGTDKADHGYPEYYEKHLPKAIGNLVEIGAWKGAGIKMFKEYYDGKGMFYAIDRFLEGHGLITIAELQSVGINSFQGSQDDMWFLETIKEQFSVLIDDASHHWDSQINTFRRMFVHNIEPGGLYVCEDIFDEPYWGRTIITNPKENLMGIFEKYKEYVNIVSPLITPSESDLICPMIDEVFMYPNILFVKKKADVKS